MRDEEILEEELRRGLLYFLNEANTDENSLGYGLIKDKSCGADDVSSIAAVGFGLATFVVGVEHEFLSYDDARKRVVGTLKTFINNVSGMHGFYYHFVDINTGKRVWNSEISIIDTAIFLSGAIVCGEYFKGEVLELSNILVDRVEWDWFRSFKKNYFRLGYSLEKGFFGYWDSYAEQLILYVLGCGSKTYPIDKSMYYSLIKSRGDYDEYKDIIYTFYGNLFTYQYSHAFIDFRNLVDEDGIDWFNNSTLATLSNRKYCIDKSHKFKTYGENSWGVSACSSPKGYKRDGAKPSGDKVYLKNDGTIPLYGAIASIVFTPKESLSAIRNYYSTPNLFDKYGFIDSFNFEKGKWYSSGVTGINKGISILMIENYFNGTIWKYFMKSPYVKRGLKVLGFRKDK